MGKESKRTEGEWRKEGNFIYIANKENTLNKVSFLVKGQNGLLTEEEEREMIDYVFKAVNNHDGLVEALRGIVVNVDNMECAEGLEYIEEIASKALKEVEESE